MKSRYKCKSRPPSQAAGGDVAEGALDHVQPQGGSRCEVDRKARMFFESFFHLGMFVVA